VKMERSLGDFALEIAGELLGTKSGEITLDTKIPPAIAAALFNRLTVSERPALVSGPAIREFSILAYATQATLRPERRMVMFQ